MAVQKINVAVIDDDAPSVEVLVKALSAYPEVTVVATGSTLADARQALQQEAPDIIFLDIELHDESGLTLLNEMISEHSGCHTRIVFYTSYKKYLIQAIRLKAFDFLLKPFDPEELRLIMTRYRLERDTPVPPATRYADIAAMRLPTERQLAVTTVTNDKLIVSPQDILYFKYDSGSKLWEIVLANLQHLILKRQTVAETILKTGSDFVRTHKSFIVNISYLSCISGNECRLIPPYDAITEIKISKGYKRELLDRFYDI